MCSIGAAVVGLIGAAAGKKMIDKKMDSAKRRATATITKTPEQDDYWGWWNNPNRNENLEGRYRLNKDIGRSQIAATRGVSQLRVPTANQGAKGSTGKAAKKRRTELGIK